MAAWRSSIRIEKLLLVAGVQPRADSSRVLATISAAQAARRAGSKGRFSMPGSLADDAAGVGLTGINAAFTAGDYTGVSHRNPP